jgi:uncharacterized membrane protein (Fun14 family)
MARMSISGSAGATAALLSILPTVGVGIVTALWMVWSLPCWRKLAALLTGILFPAALFVSLWIGADNSPDTITRRNGDAIVQSLERYHAETGTYPSELIGLVPAVLTALPEKPQTVGGWLYTITDNEYTLGYVDGVDQYGYWVCVHSSENPKWDCFVDVGNRFKLPPTPYYTDGP